MEDQEYINAMHALFMLEPYSAHIPMIRDYIESLRSENEEMRTEGNVMAATIADQENELKQNKCNVDLDFLEAQVYHICSKTEGSLNEIASNVLETIRKLR